MWPRLFRADAKLREREKEIALPGCARSVHEGVNAMWTQSLDRTGPGDGGIPEILILDKAYTRTYSQDDSFVANIRRALPGEISVDTFETSLASSVSEREYEFLRNYYERRVGPHGEAYLLRSIPQRISAEQYAGPGGFSEKDREYLFQFYSLDEKQGMYILAKHLSEADEIRILKMFNMKSLHINNVQKAMISEILEKVPDVAKKNAFFASMHVPRNHRFFSPPNLKHISGMQITEASRQFAIACHHVYGGIPLQGVTFLLESLVSEFYQYAKINLPVKLRALLKDVKLDRQGSWRTAQIEVGAYQQGTEIARVTASGTVLPMKLYKKLKAGQEEVYEIDPRFRPSDRSRNNICIRYREEGEVHKWDCQIVNFSKSGFLARSDGMEPPRQLAEDPNLEFFMHFDQAGFVHGTCRSVWAKIEEDDSYCAGFAITGMARVDSECLSDAINRFGRLVEEREIH